MKNKQAILDALSEGKVLLNNMGETVYIGEDGYQKRSNKNRNRKYHFSNPHLWMISGKTIKMIQAEEELKRYNNTSWWNKVKNTLKDSEMNLYEMIISNFSPIKTKTGRYIRKRIFHKGYEVTVKVMDSKHTDGYYHIHISYIDSI